MRPICVLILPIFALLWVACLSPDLATAEDFRVETKVYFGDAQQPSSYNTTLFQGGIVYDFVADREVTVFNPSDGTFVVMDPARKASAAVSTTQVLEFAGRLRELAAKQQDPLLQFCAKPTFQVAEGAMAGELVFRSSVMKYNIITEKPAAAAVARQYREFSDWFARLNLLMHAQALPPQARLVLNERLARDHLVPGKVVLRIEPHPRFGNRAVTLRSTHEFHAGLTDADRQRLARLQADLGATRRLSLAEYRQPARAAQK